MLQPLSSPPKKNDTLHVEGYCRTLFRVDQVDPKRQDSFLLVYAAANGDKESPFGWCSLAELRVETGE